MAIQVRSISGAKDLDEVIAAHDTYLDAVLERSLLSPSTGKRGADDEANGATLRRQLHTLFDTCIEFCKPIVGFQMVAPATFESYQEIFSEKYAQENLTKVETYFYFLRGVGI